MPWVWQKLRPVILLKLLLNVARANRLVEHHARDQQFPSLDSVLNTLWENTWLTSHQDTYLQSIQQGINWVTLLQLMELAADTKAAPMTQAQVLGFLQRQQKALKKKRKNKAFNQMAVAAITRFLENPEQKTPAKQQPIPPGSPIGMH